MKVSNIIGRNGTAVKNQFILIEEGRGANGNFIKKEVFQSYESAIAERIIWNDRTDITLDVKYWDYSKTTSKYRNLFLGEDRATTQKKIESGEYKLANLNN
jgi:hypothetical protein